MAEHIIEQWKSETKINEFAGVLEGGDLFLERLCDYIDMPKKEEIFETLQNMDKTRPRVIERKEVMLSAKTAGGFRTYLYHKLKAYAEKYPQKGVAHLEDFPALLAFAREFLDRAFILSFFHVTEGSFLTDFLKEQLKAGLEVYKTLRFAHENSMESLPLGEMTVALSIIYDWAHDYLTEEEKKDIRDAVRVKALMALGHMNPPLTYCMAQVNNWNAVVCGGLMTAAISMYEEDGDPIWGKLLAGISRCICFSVSEFVPNGGSTEGAGYWVYMMQYLYYGISSLDSALGTDFNISKIPGFSETIDYPIHLFSNDNYGFNFSDCEEGPTVTMPIYWLAHKFNRPEVFSYLKEYEPDGVDYDSWQGAHYDLPAILWYEERPADEWKNIPKSKCYKGRQQVMSVRNSWERGRAYLGFLGGYNHLPHCNLDIGTFVYDCFGIRWICDIGKEDYALPEFWDFYEGRWKYYSQRAEGHNTIVVNPDDKADQEIFGFATVDALDENTGIIDIKDAYKDLKSGTRKFSLKDDVAEIEDELTFDGEADIYWFMHTQAEVSLISEDTAVLKKEGKAVKVKFDLPEGAVLSVMEAKPLVVPVMQGAKNLDYMRKLCVHIKAKDRVSLVSRIVPEI